MSAGDGYQEREDRWAEQLATMRVGAAPGRSMLDAVGPRVRRRRTSRRLGVVGGVAVLVGAALLVPATLLDDSGGDAPPAPAPTGPMFSCAATAEELLADEPWPDVEQQRLNAVNVADLVDWKGFFVDHAEATPIGVVALVRGDLGAARRALPAYGVEAVAPAPVGAGDAEVEALVTSVVRDQVVDLAQNLGRSLEPSLGPAEVEAAPEAGRVLVRTADPAPPALAMLDGTRQGGLRGGSVEVVVLASTYAPDVVADALDRLAPALRRVDGGTQVVSTGACADGSGLVAYVMPPSGDRAALQESLGEAAGLPVMVVDREAALNGEP